MIYLKIRSLLIIICSTYLTITTSLAALTNNVPQSPCPNVFQYEFDNSNNLYGSIEVPTINADNVILLEVQLSVGNRVQGSSGSISLGTPRSRVIDDVRQNKPINYILQFPYWQNIPPLITKISINGNQLCFGYPVDRKKASTITTINLQHTLTISVSLSTGPKRPQPQPQPVTVRSTVGAFFFPTPSPNKPSEQDVPQPPRFPIQPVTARPIIGTHFVTTSPSSSEPAFIKKPFSGVCGISVRSNPLLLNGNRVPKGEHPWVAALFQQDEEGLRFLCGSTLISNKHVVTAAHCVKPKYTKLKPEELWVVIGRENIQKWANTDGAQIIQAESTHPHPESKLNTGDADIAVILLRDEVIFTSLIKPICLWTSDPNPQLIVEKSGTVVGWGKDQSGKVYTSEPRQLTFPIVSEEDCLRSHFGFREITSNRTFCAGYRNNSGPCNGDSGSGFLMRQNERWTLRGVVSTSLRSDNGGCDLMHYVVFVDTAVFMEWLLSFLN